MTIQQLRVFLKVCGEMNYTRAAAELYMSRQAVRQNISELENELGGVLFENWKNHLTLTPKAVLLREKAVPLLAAFDSLQQSMKADIQASSPLRLGISVSLIPDYLPTLSRHLLHFAESYPGIPVTQLSLANDEAVPALLAGALDVCLVMDLDAPRPTLERTVLTRHPAAVLMKNTNPLFSRERLAPEDLDGCTFLLPGLGDEFAPLFRVAEQIGATVSYTVMQNYYQVVYHVMEQDSMALNRYAPGEDPNPSIARSIPLSGLPPLCSSLLIREGTASTQISLLRDWLLKLE